MRGSGNLKASPELQSAAGQVVKTTLRPMLAVPDGVLGDRGSSTGDLQSIEPASHSSKIRSKCRFQAIEPVQHVEAHLVDDSRGIRGPRESLLEVAYERSVQCVEVTERLWTFVTGSSILSTALTNAFQLLRGPGADDAATLRGWRGGPSTPERGRWDPRAACHISDAPRPRGHGGPTTP